MKRLFSTTLPILFWEAPVFCLASAFGGEPPPPTDPASHFAGQKPGEAQAIMLRFEGTVTAVDAKHNSLTVKTADGEKTFQVTDKTTITGSDKPAKLQDLRIGMKAEIIVKHVNARGDE